MKILIIGASAIRDYRFIATLLPCDYIICADGGYHHASKLGIRPNVVIGDFDSIDRAVIPKNITTVAYDQKKDATDLELCLNHAKTLSPESVCIIGALSERMDHAIYNILLGLKYDFEISFHDDIQCVYYLKSGKTYSFNAFRVQNGDTVSFIDLNKKPLSNVFVTGVEYPFDETWFLDGKQSISNVVCDSRGTISIESGALVLIHLRVQDP